MSCREQIYSNDYYDFIIENNAYGGGYTIGECSSNVENLFTIEHRRVADSPLLSVASYDYASIPKCYSLVGENALEATGIPRVSVQPSLNLRGNGVLLGFIDTGIDYRLNAFRDSGGNTRIEAIWDQSLEDGRAPFGYDYGGEFRREQINEALRTDAPLELVPTEDVNGHGTYVASIAAGSSYEGGSFIGGAPECDIAMVKLKEAKKNLTDYFYASRSNPVYSESDIMTGVSYLNELANQLQKPLVICIALGTDAGSHGGNSPLSIYLDIMAIRGARCVVCATGNEASSQHHYYGTITDPMTYQEVELQVQGRMSGFTMELWALAPQLYEVALVSPTGDVFPKSVAQRGVSQEYLFVFENSRVTIDYRTPESTTGNQLIFFRFSNPAAGLWKVRVYSRNAVVGSFHMYLPMEHMLELPVYFLRSNPDTTIVTPGNAVRPITVGGYNDANDSLYLSSGRGYTIDGHVKPDLVAPAVDVPGIRQGSFGRPIQLAIVSQTGTSGAAAFTSAAAALYMEWAILYNDQEYINTTQVKNFLIRGTRQRPDELYPNRQWGYGILDLYRAFEQLRNM